MKKMKFLFHPLESHTEKKLISIGFLALIIGSFLGYYCNARFDGIIDVHFADKVDFWFPFIDNLIDLICLLAIFTIISKFINNKTRIVDVLAVSLVARIPIYLIALTNINNVNFNATKQLLPLAGNPEASLPIGSLILVLIFALFSILMMVWFGALLYNGFKTATNAKGRNAIMGAVVGIILAESLSKFVFFYFF